MALRKKTLQMVDEMVRLWKSGLRPKEIAGEIGLSHRLVQSRLKDRGVVGRKIGIVVPRNGACMRNRDLVLKMNSEGAYLEEIARAVGTTGVRVKYFLRREGETRNFPVNIPGEKSGQWNGGVHIDKDGYKIVYCPNHPNRRKNTPYILEHRLVMEKMIGRYLRPEEVVHHRNRVKTDNLPENLQLFSENSEHLAHELKGKCPKWTEDGLARIRKGVSRAAELKRQKKWLALERDVLRSR